MRFSDGLPQTEQCAKKRLENGAIRAWNRFPHTPHRQGKLPSRAAA